MTEIETSDLACYTVTIVVDTAEANHVGTAECRFCQQVDTCYYSSSAVEVQPVLSELSHVRSSLPHLRRILR